MRQIREVLRLKYGCGLSLSNRDIGNSCGIGKSAVTKYLGRARLAGLSWPLPEGLGDEVERRLFPPLAVPAADRPPPPDFHRLRRVAPPQEGNLTLDLLWREYLEPHPDGYRYAYYCKLYGRWRPQARLRDGRRNRQDSSSSISMRLAVLRRTTSTSFSKMWPPAIA